MRTPIVYGLLLLLATFPLFATTEFYVATNGSDTAAGTQTDPFLTLSRAQAAVRALPPREKPVTVWVRGGTYYLSSPLVFTAADSGSANAPITYQAYPHEEVTISGGIKLQPIWSTYPNNEKII